MKRLLIGALTASLLASPVFAQSGGGVVTVPPAPYTQACGSVSVSTVCWNVTETWNASGTTFSAPLTVTITDTASASGSVAFQVFGGAAGTTSLLKLDRVGALTTGSTISSGNQIIAAGTISSSGGPILAATFVKTGATTVTLLPSASTSGAGARDFVTDATACTFNSTPTGGGSTPCPVFSDGSGWKEGG